MNICRYDDPSTNVNVKDRSYNIYICSMNSNSQLERVSVRIKLISFKEEHCKNIRIRDKNSRSWWWMKSWIVTLTIDETFCKRF